MTKDASTLHYTNHFWIILLLLIILGMNVYIVWMLRGKDMESFCNCFAAQYDGSAGNPAEKCYYGGYCYDKEKITKLYDEGVFSKTFAGV